jgi:hypothetical protein
MFTPIAAPVLWMFVMTGGAAMAPPAALINEVRIDPPGADAAAPCSEYVEIYKTTVDLAPLRRRVSAQRYRRREII